MDSKTILAVLTSITLIMITKDDNTKLKKKKKRYENGFLIMVFRGLSL